MPFKAAHAPPVGTRFGRLVVVDRSFIQRHPVSGRTMQAVPCVCDCGKRCSPVLERMKSGVTQSCGCLLEEAREARRQRGRDRDAKLAAAREEQTQWTTALFSPRNSKGMKVGSCRNGLTCIGECFLLPNGRQRVKHAVFECKCGQCVVLSVSSVEKGRRRSCGCEAFTADRQWNTRLYSIWRGMKHRCSGSADARTSRLYYGKGIRVCDEWNRDFRAFRDWSVEHGYDDTLSIDRIDPERNYEPANCRWVTPSENSRHANYCEKVRRQKLSDEVQVLRATVMFLLQEVAGEAA